MPPPLVEAIAELDRLADYRDKHIVHPNVERPSPRSGASHGLSPTTRPWRLRRSRWVEARSRATLLLRSCRSSTVTWRSCLIGCPRTAHERGGQCRRLRRPRRHARRAAPRRRAWQPRRGRLPARVPPRGPQIRPERPGLPRPGTALAEPMLLAPVLLPVPLPQEVERLQLPVPIAEEPEHPPICLPHPAPSRRAALHLFSRLGGGGRRRPVHRAVADHASVGLHLSP